MPARTYGLLACCKYALLPPPASFPSCGSISLREEAAVLVLRGGRNGGGTSLASGSTEKFQLSSLCVHSAARDLSWLVQWPRGLMIVRKTGPKLDVKGYLKQPLSLMLSPCCSPTCSRSERDGSRPVTLTVRSAPIATWLCLLGVLVPISCAQQVLVLQFGWGMAARNSSALLSPGEVGSFFVANYISGHRDRGVTGFFFLLSCVSVEAVRISFLHIKWVHCLKIPSLCLLFTYFYTSTT